MKKLLGVFGLILLVSTSSFSLSKDSLTIAISSEFDNLNPVIASQAVTNFILYSVFRPLVVLNLDGKWVPMLIKEMPTIENKKAVKKGEGLEVTIELIEKAKWGDGTPVTCRDIAFAWEVGKNKNVSVPSREPFENISAITADKKNPKKCTISFVKAKYNYFNSMPDPLPAHLEEEVFKQYSVKPEGYDTNSLYTKNPSNPGLYNGPYMISEVKLGSHIIVVPNPHFYGKKPFFQKIVFKYLPNTATYEANLRAGNFDLIASASGLSLDQAVIFDKKVKSDNMPYSVIFADGVIYAHIDLNLSNPILADVRVRKALSIAFNKEDMIKSLLEGKGKIAHHFVTDKDPWYTEKVAIYKYNKREAQRLLDEAGWKMGPNGIRQKDGKPLSLTIYGGAGLKLIENILAYLQDKYKAVGIELNIKTEPGRVFFGETVPHRKYDMALYSWVSIPESTPRSTLHSSMIPSEKNSWSGQNSGGYNNPEVDKLIDVLEGELVAKKRAEVAKKIIDFYTKDIPVMPIYYRPNNAVVPKELKGFRLSGTLFYETLYCENWSL